MLTWHECSTQNGTFVLQVNGRQRSEIFKIVIWSRREHLVFVSVVLHPLVNFSLLPVNIVANHSQNVRSSPLFGHGWIRRVFIVFYCYAYWPMHLSMLRKWPLIDLKIPNGRLVYYSCWWCNNRNIVTLDEHRHTFKVWLRNVKHFFRHSNRYSIEGSYMQTPDLSSKEWPVEGCKI